MWSWTESLGLQVESGALSRWRHALVLQSVTQHLLHLQLEDANVSTSSSVCRCSEFLFTLKISGARIILLLLGPADGVD